MPRPKFPFLLATAALLALLLSACGGSAPEATATLPAPAVEAATATPTSVPGLAILLAPEGADPELAAQAAPILQTYAGERGWLFEPRASLDAAALPPNLMAVVALAPVADLAALAGAAPQATFVALGFEPEGAPANLHSLSLSASSSEAAAFLAGYVAALSTDDWRMGVVYGPGEEVLANAFLAGAEFFCGSCDPVAPPYEDYPLFVQANPADWQASVDSLLALGVRTVYLTPQMELADLVAYLAGWNALVVGQGLPPSGYEANWLASVGAGAAPDLAVDLPAALAGQVSEGAALGLSYANSVYLSEARLAFIQELILDLEEGRIRLPSQP